MEALAYIDSAFEGGADNASLRAMAGVVSFLLEGSKSIVARHDDPVLAMALSPDGHVVASLDGEAYVTVVATRDLRFR